MAVKKSDPWTIQKRFGFQDDDLKTQLHDEIIMWVDEHLENDILPKLCYRQWSYNYWENRWKDDGIPYESLPPKPNPSEFSVVEKTWEKPITTGRYNNYIVGFIDIDTTVECPVLNYNWEEKTFFIKKEIFGLCFEAKGSISSLGQLIRQIRMYQEYLKSTFIVVSPQDEYQKQLESQGIWFVKYEA